MPYLIFGIVVLSHVCALVYMYHQSRRRFWHDARVPLSDRLLSVIRFYRRPTLDRIILSLPDCHITDITKELERLEYRGVLSRELSPSYPHASLSVFYVCIDMHTA